MARIERRGENYTTRISLTDPLTGTRRQQRITARTKRGLEAEIARVRAEFQRGTWVEPGTTTLLSWMETWHATYKGSPASRYKRGVHVRKHIGADTIGAIPLSRLRYAHLQDWIDRLEATLAPNTVRGIVTTLGMALSHAVRRQIIATNPATGLDLAPAGPARWCVLDDEQARRVVTATRDDPWHAGWVLAVVLGLRRGELLALRWPNIDLDGCLLRVEQTATVDEDNRRRQIGPPKSAAGMRAIRLPSVCVDALRHQRARQNARRLAAGDVWTPSGAVLDSGLGAPWEESAAFRAFATLKRDLDLPPAMRLHDLRHTAATRMLHAGVPIPTVSKILGHANPAITMRVYSHVIAGMEERAATLIDGLFQSNSDRIVSAADG